MADLEIPQGDYGFYLNFTAQDANEVAYNLTGYTVALIVNKEGGKENPIINSVCEIVSAPAGTCRYLVVSDDFPNIASCVGKLELTKTGVIESTKKFLINVT